MTPSPTSSEPDDRAAQREADTAYYRTVLHELAELGMDLARAVARQAAPQPAQEHAAQPTPAADPTIAFERIARTIRRTIALARTLDDPAPAPRTEKASAPEAAPEHERVAARARIIRDVEDVIQRRAEGSEADSLRDELHERLADAPDLDQDLASRPIDEVIQLLLRDLGIAATFPGNRPWQRRTPADIRDLRARAAKLAGVDLSNRPEAAAPFWPPRPTTLPTRPATGPPQL